MSSRKTPIASTVTSEGATRFAAARKAFVASKSPSSGASCARTVAMASIEMSSRLAQQKLLHRGNRELKQFVLSLDDEPHGLLFGRRGQKFFGFGGRTHRLAIDGDDQ